MKKLAVLVAGGILISSCGGGSGVSNSGSAFTNVVTTTTTTSTFTSSTTTSSTSTTSTTTSTTTTTKPAGTVIVGPLRAIAPQNISARFSEADSYRFDVLVAGQVVATTTRLRDFNVAEQTVTLQDVDPGTYSIRMVAINQNREVGAALSVPFQVVNGQTTHVGTTTIPFSPTSELNGPEDFPNTTGLIWAEERDGGSTYQRDLIAFNPVTFQPAFPTAAFSISTGRKMTYDRARSRLYALGNDGLDVVSLTTAAPLSGTPLRNDFSTTGQAASFFGDTTLTDVAYDARQDQVLVTSRDGLFAIRPGDLSKINATPKLYGSADNTLQAVQFLAADNLLAIKLPVRVGASNRSGIQLVDPTTLESILPSPIAVPNPTAGTLRSGLVYDPVNRRVYLVDDDVINVFNLATRTFASPIALDMGNVQASGVLYIESQDRLYIADFAGTQIHVLRGSDLTPVAGSPFSTGRNSQCGLAFDPNSQRLFIPHFNGGGIEVYQTPAMTVVPGSPIFVTPLDGGNLSQPYDPAILWAP